LKIYNVKALLFCNAPDTQKSIALFEGSEASHGFPPDSSNVNMKMSMDRRRNEEDRTAGRERYIQRLKCEIKF
jgi:hypothetical protein